MNALESPTILIYEHITGGGLAGEPLPESLAAEGRAMRRALAAEFAAARGGGTRVIVALDSRFPPEDAPWETVSVGPGAILDRLRDIAGQADYTLVIAPETTRTLEHLTRAVEETATRPLGSSPEAVALTADKAALGRRLAQRGIPTPPFRVIEAMDRFPDDWPYPAVFKPIDGAGSTDTFQITDPSGLADRERVLTRGLLQPLVRGEAMSASFLVSPGRGAGLLAIGRQRIELRDDRFIYRGGEIPAACPGTESVLISAVESVPGLRGFVGVDFLWDPDRGEMSVLEINPRPTTSCVGLGRRLGPGLLADAWLAGFDDLERWDELIIQIAREVGSAPAVRFEADGRIALDGEEGGRK